MLQGRHTGRLVVGIVPAGQEDRPMTAVVLAGPGLRRLGTAAHLGIRQTAAVADRAEKEDSPGWQLPTLKPTPFSQDENASQVVKQFAKSQAGR